MIFWTECVCACFVVRITTLALLGIKIMIKRTKNAVVYKIIQGTIDTCSAGPMVFTVSMYFSMNFLIITFNDFGWSCITSCPANGINSR